jgi:hypothetical protein
LTLNELQEMNPKMDFSQEKKIAAGDLKNIGSVLRELPEDFKGVVRIRMTREQKTYHSDLVLQNGFIIGASISCPQDGAQLLGEKAFLGLVDFIKESSGGFETYLLADPEFKPYVASNEPMLLELVRGLGRTLEEIGHVDEDLRKEGLVDLESQWKALEAKWKQFEEREKPYLEMILKADQRDRSIETGMPREDDPLGGDDSENAGSLPPTGQAGEIDIQAPTVNASPTRSEAPPERLEPERQSNDPPRKTDGADLSDEKDLDDMILRQDPWELSDDKIVSGNGPEEKAEEKRAIQPSSTDSSEGAQLRRELQGVFHGADTKEQKEESASSEKTLSDDFNERVRDAILGRVHHRLSENAVSAPKSDQILAGRPQEVKEDVPGKQADQSAHDDWLARANNTLLRLKKKKEEKADVPSPSNTQGPVADIHVKPAEAPPIETQTPSNEPLPEDSGTDAPSTLDQELIEKIKEVSGEEWDDKTSSEISDLKKEVDVYWGWDKRKKRFVGIDGAEAPISSEKKPDEPIETVPPKAKVPLAQCKVLREELKKQAAGAREIVINKEEVAQALLAAQAPSEPSPQSDVPQLKKKIGFMDKLKYAKFPQIIKVMEKVDGKKSIDELAKETKLTPASVKYIVDKLITDGYLSMKAGQ